MNSAIDSLETCLLRCAGVTRALVVLFALGVVAGSVAVAAKDRAWQTGIVRRIEVTRPKFVFGPTAAPGAAGPAPLPSTTVNRTYTIETDALRLEVKETTTTDAPALDLDIGDVVTFAIEKNTVYIREANGKEHPLRLVKKSPRSGA